MEDDDDDDLGCTPIHEEDCCEATDETAAGSSATAAGVVPYGSDIEGARQSLPVFRGGEIEKIPPPDRMEVPEGWVRKASGSGKKEFLVHLASGNTLDCSSSSRCNKRRGLEEPREMARKKAVSKMKTTSSILPAGKTPFLSGKSKKSSSNKGHDELLTCKWGDSAMPPAPESIHSGELSSILSTWKNPNFRYETEAVALKKTNRLTKTLGPFRFERSMFQDIAVLGQVDFKFIATTVRRDQKDTLVFFDQHAVHERIRLEALIQEHYPNQTEVVSDPVDLTVTVPKEEARVLQQFPARMTKFGLDASPAIDDDDDKHHVDVAVRRVPRCFLKREVNELRCKRPSPLKELVCCLLNDVVQLVRVTVGGGLLPRTIGNVLNSRACRTAIKFGDPLSLDECRSLLRQLELCSAPFQCAHGRPSLAPILDVTGFEKAFPRQEGGYSFRLANLKAAVVQAEEDSDD